jgi:5-methylcytosine-specific restriction endonuclease McrA
MSDEQDQEYRDLLKEVDRLSSRLRDAEDLLVSCGYCRECFWDRESISDIAENILRYFRLGELTQKVWPKDCNPLCESCMKDFKEMVE